MRLKFEGDLVLLRDSFCNALGRDKENVGIVTDCWPRWPGDDRDDEMIVKILFSDTGEEEWSEYDVEFISENR